MVQYLPDDHWIVNAGDHPGRTTTDPTGLWLIGIPVVPVENDSYGDLGPLGSPTQSVASRAGTVSAFRSFAGVIETGHQGRPEASNSPISGTGATAPCQRDVKAGRTISLVFVPGRTTDH